MVTTGIGRMTLSLLFMLFLVAVPYPPAATDGEAGATALSAMNPANPDVTVFWFMDLSVPSQIEQARQIELEILRCYDGSGVRFTGVVKEAPGMNSSSYLPGTATNDHTISLTSFSDLYGETIQRAAAQSGLASHDGSLALQRLGMVLLDRKGRVLVREAPLSFPEAMRDVRAATVVTKVDESTWGKIKELFR